jgi:hypothetical protein
MKEEGGKIGWAVVESEGKTGWEGFDGMRVRGEVVSARGPAALPPGG